MSDVVEEEWQNGKPELGYGPPSWKYLDVFAGGPRDFARACVSRYRANLLKDLQQIKEKYDSATFAVLAIQEVEALLKEEIKSSI
ncbi:MAG: hypothetical protein ACYCQJ_12785 [Nitrososphaerales archaeon]